MLIGLLLKILKKCLNHNLINLKNLIITKGNNIKTFPLNKRKVYKSKANEDEFKKL